MMKPALTQSVKEKLVSLKMKTAAETIDQILETGNQKNMSCLEIIEHLLEIELEAKQKNRIARLFKESKLTEKLTIDQFDFNFHKARKKHKNRILGLMEPGFVTQKMDVILIGNSGVGKTFLAKCIAYAAILTGVKVLFTTAADMINQLIAAEADHSVLKKLRYYQSPDLLVCDEIGYLPLGAAGSNMFFQVISERHEKKSTLITTNLPFSQWGNIFDSTTVAAAIADRLVYNAEILIMEGESYRKRMKK